MTRRRGSTLVPAVFLWLTACFVGCSSEQSVDLGTIDEIAGLVGISAPKGGNPPKAVAGVSPKLSSGLVDALAKQSNDVEAVVRVLIDSKGDAIGVRIVEYRPSDSPEAERYATEVSQSVWDWRYESAERDGSPVRAYLDLAFRYDAGAGG